MKLLACGSNGNFQLGNGSDADFNTLVPSKFLVDGKPQDLIHLTVRQIACGGNHTFILFTTGQLFSCGDNTYGQCGHSNDSGDAHIRIFTQIPGIWTHVSCGWEFSVLVNHHNDIYVCGLGLLGELGLGKTTSTQLTLVMSLRNNVEVLKSSINFTLLKDCSGTYYGWGNSKKGQLFTKSIVWQPLQLEMPVKEPVVDFHFTRDSTILQTSQALIAFGRMALEEQISLEAQVKTMWSSVHYKHNHTITSIGKNTHGQHFPHDSLIITSGDFDFTVGSEHGMVRMLSTNEIFTWGWGEHGNCGYSSISDHDQITFHRLNHLYTGPVEHMAGGCATTFLVIKTHTQNTTDKE